MFPKVNSALPPSTDQVDSAVDLVFGPLQTFLRVVGLLGPRPDSHAVVRALLWLHWALTGTILFLGGFVKAAMCLPLGGDQRVIVKYAWEIVYTAIVMLIYVHWKVVLEKKLAGMLQELNELEQAVGRPCFLNPRATRRNFFLFLVANVIFGSGGIYNDYDSFLDTLKSQNCLVPILINQNISLLYITQAVSLTTFLVGLQAGFFSLYVLLCSSISRMFQALNQKLRARITDSTVVIEEGEMEEYRSCHQRLCCLTREVDNLFVLLVSALLLFSLMCYFLSIYMAIFDNILGDNAGEIVAFIVFSIMYGAVILSQAIRIQEQACSIKETLNRIPSSRMSDRTLALVSLFCSEMNFEPAGLTVAKTFLLDRGIYVTLFGALLSYTIILIQSKPAKSPMAPWALNMTGNVTEQ